MILFILCLLVITWTVSFRYKRRRLYELASKLPTLPGENAILGQAYRLLGDTEHILKALRWASYSTMEVGGTSRVWLSHRFYAFINDPVDTEFILKTCLEKDDTYQFMRTFTGNGIIFGPMSTWPRRRKIMLHAFAQKNVTPLINSVVDSSRILAEQLEVCCGTGQFEVWPFITRYTFDSVCETTLGIKLNSQSGQDVPFLTKLSLATNLVSERIFCVWYQPDWLYKLFRNKYADHENCKQECTEFVDEVISKHSSVDNSKTTENYSSAFTEEKPKVFLDLLIDISGKGKGYNQVELREEMLSIILAGTDSSAIVISNTLVLLTKYPDVQDRIHQELSTVFQDSDEEIQIEHLSKLEYLERVIKESLRLFPPTPVLARKIVRETKLPSGYILPAGAGTVIDVWGAHHDPKYWGQDVEVFDPDRFLSERFNLLHPCSYIPFSSRPRNCTGYQYATLTVKIALTSILRRYKVLGTPEVGPIPNIRMKVDVLMKAVDGYYITLEKKQNTQ